jgi:adenylate cyclase
VTAQLIDATTGRHVWAERYDRSMADLFDIQDEITRSVVSSTETQVLLAESESADLRRSTDFEVRDLVVRAWGRLYLQTPEATAEASDFVEKAIRIDPSNPSAHIQRAMVYLDRIWHGELPDDETNLARAFELAKTALKFGPRHEWAHYVMAETYGYAGRYEEAVAECKLGLEISPNNAGLLSEMAGFLALLGRSQEAIQASLLALRLNPRDPLSFWRHSHIATAHFAAEEYEAALQESKQVAQLRPHLPTAVIWAASAAALGRAEEAQKAAQHCLTQRPDLHIGRMPYLLRFARKEDNERLLMLLREAGLPE